MDLQVLFLRITAGVATSAEMVESVLAGVASGVSRTWRSPLQAAGAARSLLGALVVGFGSALPNLVPLDLLRGFIGLQRLRKAMLWAAGFIVLRDEDTLFDKGVKNLVRGKTVRTGQFDGTAFTVRFKGVFLEGVEVVLSSISFGSIASCPGLAAVDAAIVAVIVGLVGLVLAWQLSKVPETATKMGVGLMLVTFGTFWVGEGFGIEWPGRISLA